MNRRTILVGVALCFAASCGSPSTDVPPPNMVVIVVDDLRWDDFGAAGHPFVETPNIDRIAREGARFLNAFAVHPICSPSRANILTGEYGHTNGVVDNTDHSDISHAFETFPRALDRVGYETAFIGKWHMGNDDSRRPGFDRWVAMRGQGEALDPVLNVDGERQQFTGYVTDILTDQAVSFIENAQAPFMLFFAEKALHPNVYQADDGTAIDLPGQRSGFIPAPRHEGRYANATVPRRPNAFVPPDGKPALQRTIDTLPPLGPATGTDDATVRGRLEMLLAVDEGLGRILETLTNRGILDHTVVIVTSDHGYFYGEHGLSAERRLAYEETIRIPLLVRYPSLVPAGSTPEPFALTLDLAPTLMELGGAEPAAPLHGRSLLPVLTGQVTQWRRPFLIEYFSDTVFPRIFRMGYQAVRTDRFKYIHYTDLQDADELYDLETDPYELDNLIDDPEHAGALEDLKAELARLLAESA